MTTTATGTGLPRTGDIVTLARAASVQFAGRPIVFRVIRVHDWTTYRGWIWLDGYELNNRGQAVERRCVFVMIDGIQRVPATHTYPRPAPRATANRATQTRGQRHPRDVSHGNDSRAAAGSGRRHR